MGREMPAHRLPRVDEAADNFIPDVEQSELRELHWLRPATGERVDTGCAVRHAHTVLAEMTLIESRVAKLLTELERDGKAIIERADLLCAEIERQWPNLKADDR
jgi:hypothetical protein